MVEELVDDVTNLTKEMNRLTYHSTLFPDPATKSQSISRSDTKSTKDLGHTFPIQPQERTLRFPFVVYRTLGEPITGPSVMNFTCDKVVT